MEKTEILELPVKKTKKRTLKKPVKILIFLIITIFVVASLLVGGFVYLLSPVSSDTAEITYVIQSGQSVYSVGKSLESKKIIRNFYAYKLYVKLTSVNNFKAGTYTVNKAMSTTQIIDTLVNNYVNKGVNVTFKEGKTIRNVAKIISQNTKNTEVMVYEKLQDKEYIDTLIEKYWFLDKDIKNNNIYYPLEGYLFPETYNFSENMSVEKIFEIM
ncbi:MAG: endolytic transglycosylase MltG, partial [Bacilli bacterium]